MKPGQPHVPCGPIVSFVYTEYLWTSGAYDSVNRVWYWDSTGEEFGEYRNWKDQEPVFVPRSARATFLSEDTLNHNWHMKPDGEEELYYICEVKLG